MHVREDLVWYRSMTIFLFQSFLFRSSISVYGDDQNKGEGNLVGSFIGHWKIFFLFILLLRIQLRLCVSRIKTQKTGIYINLIW